MFYKHTFERKYPYNSTGKYATATEYALNCAQYYYGEKRALPDYRQIFINIYLQMFLLYFLLQYHSGQKKVLLIRLRIQIKLTISRTPRSRFSGYPHFTLVIHFTVSIKTSHPLNANCFNGYSHVHASSLPITLKFDRPRSICVNTKYDYSVPEIV